VQATCAADIRSLFGRKTVAICLRLAPEGGGTVGILGEAASLNCAGNRFCHGHALRSGAYWTISLMTALLRIRRLSCAPT